jgi:glycerol kinase
MVVTGGMSQSDWLCQRLADLVGLAVCRGDQEATARGVAMLAAPWLPAPSVGSGAALQRFSPTGPQAALQARYQALLELLG